MQLKLKRIIVLNTSNDRKKRLSDALRQNLLKRKKQQKDRKFNDAEALVVKQEKQEITDCVFEAEEDCE